MIQNSNLKATRAIGESKMMTGHITKQIQLTQTEACLLIKLVCDRMKWPVYDCIYTGRSTQRTNATVWKNENLGIYRMKVNKRGERVCTILHELAHHPCGHNHGPNFKRYHNMLIKLWESDFKNHFTIVTWETSFDKPIVVHIKKQKSMKFHRYDRTILFTKKDSIKKHIPTTAEIKQMIIQVVEEIIDEFEESTVVSMGLIGRKLVEVGINNINNIREVVNNLKDLGYSIKGICM